MVVVFVHKHECVQLYWVVLRSDSSSAGLLMGYTSSCCVFFCTVKTLFLPSYQQDASLCAFSSAAVVCIVPWA